MTCDFPDASVFFFWNMLDNFCILEMLWVLKRRTLMGMLWPLGKVSEFRDSFVCRTTGLSWPPTHTIAYERITLKITQILKCKTSQILKCKLRWILKCKLSQILKCRLSQIMKLNSELPSSIVHWVAY